MNKSKQYIEDQQHFHRSTNICYIAGSNVQQIKSLFWRLNKSVIAGDQQKNVHALLFRKCIFKNFQIFYLNIIYV